MKLSREERQLRREQKKERRENRKAWKRSGKFNRHHIKNKCNGGQGSKSNLLVMDTRRHQAWHLLFRNMSFREVAELLLRTCQIKGQED